MDDYLVHITPNHHPPKINVLSKTFLQFILAAKWLVRHSSSSLNQHRLPLPSLLSDSYSMGHTVIIDQNHLEAGLPEPGKPSH